MRDVAIATFLTGLILFCVAWMWAGWVIISRLFDRLERRAIKRVMERADTQREP